MPATCTDRRQSMDFVPSWPVKPRLLRPSPSPSRLAPSRTTLHLSAPLRPVPSRHRLSPPKPSDTQRPLPPRPASFHSHPTSYIQPRPSGASRIKVKPPVCAVKSVWFVIVCHSVSPPSYLLLLLASSPPAVSLCSGSCLVRVLSIVIVFFIFFQMDNKYYTTVLY